MFKKIHHIHFVGIGGAGMSGIAEVLLNLGYRISGSDIAKSETTSKIKNMGGRIFIGHRAGNVASADVVVISSAVPPTNPEIITASKRKIPVIPRAEMLAELMRLKYAVTIAGTHGKTSATSMAGMVLAAGGKDPTLVIGGKLINIDSHARLGGGDYFVAEADESDGSFLKLTPAIAVVTNIDNDHLDYYKNIENIKDAFVQFLNRVPFYGCAIVCGDDPNVRAILPSIKRKYYTYGINGKYDFVARNIKSKGVRTEFDVFARGIRLGRFTLHVPGMHNVSNAVSAVAVGYEVGIKYGKMKKALSDFKGVKRRLEIKGHKKGIIFLDDYGHHPTEIKATLSAVRRTWKGRRIIVIFQPHRYTRTRALAYDFSKSFGLANKLRLMPVYAAGEKPIPNVSSESILVHFPRSNRRGIRFMPNREELIETVSKELRSNDILLTLGAGDVYRAGEEIMKRK